jgi:hypothetical protein
MKNFELRFIIIIIFYSKDNGTWRICLGLPMQGAIALGFKWVTHVIFFPSQVPYFTESKTHVFRYIFTSLKLLCLISCLCFLRVQSILTLSQSHYFRLAGTLYLTGLTVCLELCWALEMTALSHSYETARILPYVALPYAIPTPPHPRQL